MIPDPEPFAAARCVGRWTEWETDPLPDEDRPDRLERLRWAATQCRQCVAFDACRTLSDQTPHKHRAHHVWAGVVPPLAKDKP